MRDLINIMNEAAKPLKSKVGPVNIDKMKADFVTVSKMLRSHQFAIPLNRKVADLIAADAKKTVDLYNSEDPEDPAPQIADLISDPSYSMANVWQRAGLAFHQVRRDEEHAQHAPLGYHDRNADRFGSDDEGQVVEDSNYLRGMHAQVEAAETLQHLKFYNLSDIAKAVEILKTFIHTFENESHVTDGGEEPILLESFVEGVGTIIPVIALRLSV